MDTIKFFGSKHDIEALTKAFSDAGIEEIHDMTIRASSPNEVTFAK